MTEIVARSPMFELAALMLSNDYARSKADEENIAAARHEQLRALDDQARSLHEAADDVRFGAFVGGLATVAGAGLSISAHLDAPVGTLPSGELAARLKAGDALGSLAPALEHVLGTAPSGDANADATQAESRAADAGARADDARRHHERVADNEDRTLAAVRGTLESESQGNLAVIANV
jgi:hypothetical protein